MAGAQCGAGYDRGAVDGRLWQVGSGWQAVTGEQLWAGYDRGQWRVGSDRRTMDGWLCQGDSGGQVLTGGSERREAEGRL